MAFMSNALITGANRGIGLELTRAYASRGVHVFATCRHPASAADLQDIAHHEDGMVSVVELDVTEPASIVTAAVEVDHEPLDVLINNAGVNSPDHQSPFDMDFDGWAHAFAVNTMGPLRVIQEFRPNLKAGRHPKVAIISSRMGSFSGGSSGYLAYCSTKTAVNRVAQLISGDLVRQGIALTVLHPGWVRTAMGGRGAPLSTRDSAAGIVKIIDRLSLETSGQFLEVDGRPIPW